jgi:RNA polymerase sigma factor (sigma-70 family)
MKAASEVELINKVLEGDKEAFNRLVRKHYSFCLSKAVQLIKDKDTAKDLAQNALLEAYFNIHNLRNKHAFKYWIAGIVTTICKNYMRDTGRKFSSLKQYYEALPDSADTTQEERTIQIIVKAIGTLDEKYGKIVYAFYYEQKSILDICAEFSLTEASVKIRLHRARKALKRILEQEPELKQYQQYFKHQNTMKQVRIIDMILGGVNKESCSLLLYDEEAFRVLPVIIKKEEAEAMLSSMKNIDFPRPMTFNLIAEIIRTNSLQPEGVYITDIANGVFIAHLKVSTAKEVKLYDARPSDAITIAVMFNCPIFVSQKILDKAGFIVPDKYKCLLPQQKGISFLTQLVEKSLADMQTKIAATQLKKSEEAVQQQIDNLMKYVFEEI